MDSNFQKRLLTTFSSSLSFASILQASLASFSQTALSALFVTLQKYEAYTPYLTTASILVVSATLLSVRKKHFDNLPFSLLSESDLFYISKCKSQLYRCKKPIHSEFLVSSIVVYEDMNGIERFESGVNSETCVLSSAICAERCALVQIRLRDHGCKTLKTVYITATSDELITPGLLCREFMLEYIEKDEDVKIVLFTPHFNDKVDHYSLSNNSYKVYKLRDLYPYPPLYHKISREKLLKHGEDFSSRFAPFDSTAASIFVRTQSLISLPPSRFQQLYDSVLRIAQHDRKESDSLYPIHLASGVLFADASTERTRQDKALEYGCTIDSISKLLHSIELGVSKGCYPIFLITVDQFGICWAPSAPVRAWLSESLLSTEVKITLPIHLKDRSLEYITHCELSPVCPAITLDKTTTSYSNMKSNISSLADNSTVTVVNTVNTVASTVSNATSTSGNHSRDRNLGTLPSTFLESKSIIVVDAPPEKYKQDAAIVQKQQQQVLQSARTVAEKKTISSLSIQSTNGSGIALPKKAPRLFQAVKKLDGIRAFTAASK
jgi:cytidine deaminase